MRNTTFQKNLKISKDCRAFAHVTEIDRLRQLLSHPFDEQPEMEQYAAPPPDGAKRIAVSCSS
jgi:uncharacterized protein YdiU (UPF0061 family)